MPHQEKLRIYVENRNDAFGKHFLVSEEALRKALGENAGRTEILMHENSAPDLAALGQADFFIGIAFDTARLGEHGTKLKAIHSLSAGVDRYMPLDWLPAGAVLTNSSGAHEEKAAQYGLMAVLMLNEHIPRFATAQKRHCWDQVFASSIKGKTAVFFGTGTLGGAVAACLKQLGVRCIGISRTGRPHESFDACYSGQALHEWLPKADFLVVATPLTAATRNAIGADEIALLPPHAGVVNIGRAAVMDYRALCDALKESRLSGAVLDVFDQEPLPEDSDLWDVPNLIVTPHTSCDDHDNYIDRCLAIFAENVDRHLRGLPFENIVDPTHQY